MITPADITDDIIKSYADRAFAVGDLGGWNLACSAMSDSPLAHRRDLFAAIRARLCDRINSVASTGSTSDVIVMLVAQRR